MDRPLKIRKPEHKVAVIAALIALSAFLTYYFHHVLGYGQVFTHFFYVPIILAALWWQRKGLAIPILLALMLMISHLIFQRNLPIVDDLFRSLIFVVIGIVFAATGCPHEEIETDI